MCHMQRTCAKKWATATRAGEDAKPGAHAPRFRNRMRVSRDECQALARGRPATKTTRSTNRKHRRFVFSSGMPCVWAETPLCDANICAYPTFVRSGRKRVSDESQTVWPAHHSEEVTDIATPKQLVGPRLILSRCLWPSRCGRLQRVP